MRYCDMIWGTVTWLEVLWRDLRYCDVILGIVTWYEVPWRDWRYYDVTWGIMTWFEMLWRDLRYCGVIWGTVTWFELLWSGVMYCDMIWVIMTWLEALSCDLRCCGVTWDTTTWNEILWRVLRDCDVIWCIVTWFHLLCLYRTHFRRLVLLITAMITQNRLAQFLTYHTIFMWSRVEHFSLARLETRINWIMSLNFKPDLGIQSLNKRLTKFVINFIFIGHFRYFFTSSRVLETVYWR